MRGGKRGCRGGEKLREMETVDGTKLLLLKILKPFHANTGIYLIAKAKQIVI